MLLGRRGRDGTVVGLTTTCVISACHQQGCEVETRSSRGVPDTILCEKVCQCLAAGRRFPQRIQLTSTI